MLQDCPPRRVTLDRAPPSPASLSSSVTGRWVGEEQGLEIPIYYVQQARLTSQGPHSRLVESPNPPMPVAQLGPGQRPVTTGRAGLSTPSPNSQSTPRLLPLCPCLAEPKWEVVSGPGATPSLSTPPPGSPPEGLEWAMARRAGKGPNWNQFPQL